MQPDGLLEALRNIAEWRAVGRQQNVIRSIGEEVARKRLTEADTQGDEG